MSIKRIRLNEANNVQLLSGAKAWCLDVVETRPRAKKNVSYPLNAWITIDGNRSRL